MNMKSFLIVVGSSAMLSAMFFGSACIITPGTTTGSGGAGASDTGGGNGAGGKASGAGGAGGTTTHQGGAGGAPACDPPINAATDNCYTCAESITFDICATPDLCATAKGPRDALDACVCSADAAVGLCQAACKDTACAGMTPSADCTTCIQDSVKGCGNLQSDCANH